MLSADAAYSNPVEQSVKKQDLKSSLIDRLRRRVLHWEYPPGYRLTEEQLCAEFGVSRSPVREALHMLLANGLIERTGRRGYVVRQLDLRGIAELYEMRLALESWVVECLCNRGMPRETLKALKRTWLAVLRNPVESNERLAAMDREFHETLAAAVGNETLLRQLAAINDRISIFRDLDFAIEGRDVGTCRQHLAILRRIEARDVEGARAAMRLNVEDGLKNVETVIKDVLAKSYGLHTRKLR